MKVISMYLPQFHRVPENDIWWGEGFTEWTAVKRAKSLYSGHVQPKIPLMERYYDLMDEDSLRWQADLMNKYGVDGQCFYHYWFENGRRILEKPAEKLLECGDINMPYCFCWANVSWARSWSNISNSASWATDFETSDDLEQNDGILLKQAYGGRADWEDHYFYLASFFKDERYIKVNNKPCFLIYKASDIPCLIEMLEVWNGLSKMDGFDGLYVIASGVNLSGNPFISKNIIYQPNMFFQDRAYRDSIENSTVIKVSYDEMWDTIIETQMDENTLIEGVVSYDDTPRRGKDGVVVVGATPEKFCDGLGKLIAKHKAFGHEYLFINAWNEWGEGMYLEPDETDGYGYLMAISTARSNSKNHLNWFKKQQEQLNEQSNFCVLNDNAYKHKHYMELFDRWLYLLEEGQSISDILIKKGITNVALYGYGITGKHLFNELKNSEVMVTCIIDKYKSNINVDVPVIKPQDVTSKVGTIVVTSTYYYDEIYLELKGKGLKNIISLQSLLMT